MGLRLIVGLGNPGPTYARNRHNIGFQLVDRIAETYGLTFARRQFRALVAGGQAAGQRLLLAKPLTFMNLSGNAVGALMRFYKLAPHDLLVTYDDLDLPLGRVRLRAQGGSGGHKGMKSIIERLGTEDFTRLRIGIGRPLVGDPVDYVLQDFTAEEKAQVAHVLDRAQEAALAWLTDGSDAAMNLFNR